MLNGYKIRWFIAIGTGCAARPHHRVLYEYIVTDSPKRISHHKVIIV